MAFNTYTINCYDDNHVLLERRLLFFLRFGGDGQNRKKYKHYKSTVLCKTKTKKSSSSQVVENKE